MILTDKSVDHKKNIALITIGLVLFFVDAYIALISTSRLYELLNFIPNELAREAALWIIQFVFLSVIAEAANIAVNIVYKFIWLMKNRSIYYDGMWLNIHKKGNIKIGVVSIKQSYSELEVTGTNIPIQTGSAEPQRTTWYYIGSMLTPPGDMQDELIGCYIANRSREMNKYGVHIFDKVTLSGGKPSILKGEFGDILRKNQTHIDSSDMTGEIYLYRLPNCIKKYINCKGNNDRNFDYHKLSNLVELVKTDTETKSELLQKIRDTDFYKKLEALVAEREDSAVSV